MVPDDRNRNTYLVTHPHTFGLGQAHSFFCIGAFVSPLVCQTLLAQGWAWNNFYYLSTALSSTGATMLILTFRPTDQEFLQETKWDERSDTSSDLTKTNSKDSSEPPSPASTIDKEKMALELRASVDNPDNSKWAKVFKTRIGAKLLSLVLWTALMSPIVWSFGLVAFLYVGVESSTTGYVRPHTLYMAKL